jgi:hypothetical protein
MSADFTPDPPEPLPIASAEDELGDQGMRAVDRIVSEDLGWVFRDQTRKDFGIDALIELVQSDRRVTGRMIAAQIKCGSSWFAKPTSDGSGWRYRGELRHLNYWLGHSLPVIIVLCDPDTDECYFTHVTEERVHRTEKGWSIVVLQSQTLDAAARKQLERLTRAPQRKDVIEFALLQHLVDRWGDRLKICPILETPRDFHRFAHAAALDDRARLQTAQGRAGPRPLRGPQLARLSPPLHAGDRRPRLPDPGAAYAFRGSVG